MVKDAVRAGHRDDETNREPQTVAAFPAGDRSRLLPEQARRKYLAIKGQCANANAIARELSGQLNDLREKIQSKAAERSHFLSGAHDGLSHGDKEPYAAEFAAEIKDLAETRNILEDRAAAHAERRNALVTLERRLTEFLSSVSTVPAAASPIDLELPAEKVDAELAKKRAHIRELKKQAALVECAHHPSGTTKDRARAQIEARATPPNVRVALEHGENFRFPMKVEKTGGVIDVEGLLCWLLRDQLIAAVSREIDEAADDTSALDDATRKRLRADLSAKLFSAESEEEAIISAAEAVGRTFDRRADADVRAVLGLAAARP